MKKFKRLRVIFLLLIAAVVMGSPFFWMAISSLKPNAELFSWPPTFVPRHLTLDHYTTALTTRGFERYFLNSAVVSLISMAFNLVFCSLAGYAFARLDFPLKNFLFLLLLSTMMIPVQVTLIPTFLMVKSFPLAGGNNIFGQGGTGLLNTYAGLVVPHIMSVFGVFIMRQFYMQFPRELSEAARIDGAREISIFTRIFLPLGKPAMSALAIFTFTQAWDDFLWPLVVTSDRNMRTLQLGLEVFKNRYTADWGPLMAATTVSILPVILIFVVFQRYFTDTALSSGIK
ncbi:MAG TPA: carbohydrate ABC transporter permease [Mesotoga sp.]|jgi:multiple sugar transport system permease protein|nr:carbohydrate ABC transporter permease [Mesotoga sp.]MDI9374345.1 carbohydrate ABC transporter permease [Thermotogota bacterium]NLX33333.1 carbohydrate ABC transporter permease [Thermotogaceae bacterium]MDD4041728.1 carbohydrate ABC transporter permease [Mesotoga sp.]MDD4478420.1 carbohydrate ABC transporter permease [Mesotoga sp.]